MEQHAVPQNVTTFQFRLIGDMTIKQFGYLCAGAILAFISYKLPLPPLITWPVTGAFFFLGIGFAFVPIEERPMDVWVFSFFKSIYNPTQYVWQQEMPKPVTRASPPPVKQMAPPAKPAASVMQPMQPQPVAPPAEKPLIVSTHPPKTVLHQVMDSFNVPPPASAPKPPPSPPVSPLPAEPAKDNKKELEKISKLEDSVKILQSQLAEKSMTDKRLEELQKQLTDVMRQKTAMEEELVTIKRQLQANPEPEKKENFTAQNQPRVNVITNAETAVRIGLPKLTNIPNVITGIIKDDTSNFLPGILVTIINMQKIPMRAFKTNKLGQFGATTPLPNGTYIIEIEDPRQRFTFDRVQMTLQGKVVPALEILAKGQKQLVREKLTQEIFGKQPM